MYSVTERPDAAWAASNMGGEADEYDVINTGGTVIDGNSRAWSDLSRAIARKPLDYAAVEQLLDIDDFIDYFLVNQYVGNWDWPHNNWFASRRRVDGAMAFPQLGRRGGFPERSRESHHGRQDHRRGRPRQHLPGTAHDP